MLAIQALKKQEILLVRKAALIYGVPNLTLHNQLYGIDNRVESRVNLTKLTKIKENSIK